MICKCSFCREDFKASQEEINLYEDGWIDRPSVCQDCADNADELPDFDYMSHSDADPGL